MLHTAIRPAQEDHHPRHSHSHSHSHSSHNPHRASTSREARGGAAAAAIDSSDPTDRVLSHGLGTDRRLRRRQREAFLRVQHKIGERQDKARALVLSANVLSLSVMTSQLSMYRWRVTEVQTAAEATATLHEEVAEATRRAYRVARPVPPPLETDAARAGRRHTGRHKARAAEGAGPRPASGHSKYAAAVAAARNGGEAAENLRRLFARRVERSMRRADAGGAADDAAAAPVTAVGESAGEGGEDHGGVSAGAIVSYLGQKGSRRSSSSSSDAATSSSSYSSSSSSSRSHSSAELSGAALEHGSADGAHPRLPPQGAGRSPADAAAPPADAITRLVLVDSYTHEPLEDIVAQLRFLDREFGLQLIIVLLLSDEEGERLANVQGSGVAVGPKFRSTVESAYAAGYDLVLTHCFDHTLVEFLTTTFVSSAGRWRNDVRSKAAVGNHVSLKNVLLGRIDIDALRGLVFNEDVDDADLMEAIGRNSLALQGETKKYSLAGMRLSTLQQQQQQLQQQQQQQQHDGKDGDASTAGMDAPAASAGGADVLTIIGDDAPASADPSTDASASARLIPAGLPRLRSRGRPAAGGVRAARGEAFVPPLATLDAGGDVIGATMQATAALQRVAASGRADVTAPLVDTASESRAVYMEAIEAEMARLIAESERKQMALDLMETEMSRLHKTVTVLRRKLGGGGGSILGHTSPGLDSGEAAGEAGGAAAAGAGLAYGRPDSGSLVNLTKEQQIYILKERLEAANERIADLMQDTDGGRNARVSVSGSRGGTSSGGLGTGSGTMQHRRLNTAYGAGGNANTATDARRVQLQRQRRQAALLGYQQRREAEQLALHDVDAEWMAALCGDGGLDESSDDTDGGGGRRRGRAAKAAADTFELEAAVRRRERADAEATMAALQQEIFLEQQQLQAQRNGEAGGPAGRRQLILTRLEEALERLQTQTRRVASMEELRQVELAVHRRQVEQLQLAVARAASSGSQRGAGEKARPAAKAKKSRATRTSSAVGSGGGSAATRTASPADKNRSGTAATAAAATSAATAAANANANAAAVQKLKARHAQELAELQVSLTKDKVAAVARALEEERRYGRQQQREREALVSERLAELYTRLRKPRSSAYRALLERDQASAAQEARGAWQRLQYILTSASPSEERDTDGDGHLLEGPIARLSEAARRQRAARIAREHAHYTLRAQRAAKELAALDDEEAAAPTAQQPAETAEPSHPTREALLCRWAEQQQRVQDAHDHSPDVGVYLRELLALSEVEDALAAVGEVDCSPALRHSQVWRSFGLAVEAAEQRTRGRGAAEVVAPTASATSAATAQDTVLVHVPAAAGATPAGALCVPLQDADGLLASIADVFQAVVATAGSLADPSAPAEEGSGQPHATKAPPRAKAAASTVSARPASHPATVSDAIPDAALLQRQADMVTALRQSGASAALRELYAVVQASFARGHVHPDRMADVDHHMCLDPCVLPPPTPAAAAAAYLAQRRELLRALRVLQVVEPFLDTVLAGYTAPALEESVAAEVVRLSQPPQASADETTGEGGATVTLPLVMAADAAVVGSVVDLLGTATAQVLADDPTTSPAHAEALEAVLRPPATATTAAEHVSDTLAADRVHSYTNTRPAVVQSLQATHRARTAAGRGRMAGGTSPVPRPAPGSAEVGGEVGPLSALARLLGGAGLMETDTGGGESAAVAEVKAILDDNRHFIGADDDALVHAYAERYPTGSAPYTPEDLARLFSKRRPRGPGAAGKPLLTLEDIYLEQGDLALEPDTLGENVTGDDENCAAIRELRLELAYLNGARRQRMEELVLRYRLHQRLASGGQPGDGTDPVEGNEAGEDDDGVPREVPTFDVKSGHAAWYGMEAAKRVKDILRRRARPGQVIVGGGPDGGGVGVELSRRTAFPAPPPSTAGLESTQTPQERLRAAHTALPPLRRRGLSRWQQRHQQRSRDGGAGDEEEEGYVPPRDEASLNAFGTVASRFEFDGVDRVLYTPQALTDRVLQYRAAVTRAASRIGTGGHPVIAARLGPPFYTPVLVGGGAGAGSRHSPSPSQAPPQPQPQPRVEATTWTYGIPPEEVRALLAAPSPEPGADPRGAAVLFLPHKTHSSVTGGGEGERGVEPPHGRSSPPRASLPRPQPRPTATGGASYASPAALAAQHISALLRASMSDPTVGAGSRFSSAITLPGGRRLSEPARLDGTLRPAQPPSPDDHSEADEAAS